jgi:putative ABC transport system permease protein
MIGAFPTVGYIPFDDPPPPGTGPTAHYRVVSPSYLPTLGVRWKAGRNFADSDILQGGDVVVVSEGLAEARWPGRSPLGQRISFVGEYERARTIVGVVADAHLTSLDEAPEHVAYVPLALNSWPNMLATGVLVVRSSLGPAQLETAIREALRRVDPGQPAPRLRSLEGAALGSVAKRRFLSTLIFAFAAIAALIAACGVFGAFDYMATRRTRELAIRQAIGATRGWILRETMIQASRPLALGLLLAGVLVYALLKVGKSYLLDWAATDAGVALSAALMLLAIALIASWLPVRSVLRRSLAHQMRE